MAIITCNFWVCAISDVPMQCYTDQWRRQTITPSSTFKDELYFQE